MKNLVFTSFLYSPETNLAHTIPLDVYEKNIFLSLTSAKNYNTNDEIALVSDKSTINLFSFDFISALKSNGIAIIEVPFKWFYQRLIWSFSLYTLCVLKYLCDNCNYDNILFIDSDTVTVDSYNDIWDDCSHFLLLYDILHSHLQKQSLDHVEEYFNLTNKRVFLQIMGENFWLLQEIICLFLYINVFRYLLI